MTTEEFKTGEYVVYLNGTYRIENDGKHYILFSVNENTSTPVVHVQYGSSRLRLWTVQDAKDGDVLSYVTYEEDLWIMIYWSLYEPYEGHVHYHALLVNDNFSDKGTCCICIDNLKPATKEQRDLLFQKMKEAGYEWDSHTKKIIEVTMATIDYKEKYMQALERARQFSEKPYLEDSAGIVEYIFPELKESEDVIRKELISFLKSPFVNENITDEKVAPWIAWLEKQGMPAKYHDICDTCVRQPTCQSDCFLQQSEQKPTDKVEPKFKVGDKIKLAKEPKYPAREIIAIKNDAYYFDELVHLPLRFQDEWELVEQKPADKVESSAFKDKLLELFQKFRYIKEGVPTNGDIIDYVDAHIQELIDTVQNKPWSEEDYNMLDELLDYCEHSIAYNGKGTLQANVWEQRKNWLKSLKDRVQPQPRQEWSEEDDRMYSRIVSFIPQHLTAESYTACINWLKSLRPQSQWKPSDMELEVLRLAAEKDGTCLMGLYEQLKKLREE